MAILYNIINHALLSEGAKALGPSQLNAYQTVAEVLLGFTDVAVFTDADKAAKAAASVAMQVSYLVESGTEAFITSQVIRGGRQMMYRGGGSRKMPPLHPVARRMATKLLQSSTASTVR